ncbi:porin [Pararobbsia alpina]|uniref:porin n=1 Tax=Pararobbsia alpina TaxID=621374 RepID=UPI0024838C03|nr:porin [Pararobbsia alpina]
MSKVIFGGVITLSCGMAQAQSSMTLYGIVDAGLLYTNKTPNPTTFQNEGGQFSMNDSGSSPSQFGMKGVEDLGGGLKAEFDLESGIDMANGGYDDSNGNLFGREAWVALDGNFGDLKAGLQFSPFFFAVAESDPRDLSQFGSALILFIDNAVATGIFTSNAVSYTSPNIDGLKGSVMLALGGAAGDFQAGRQYSASLKYENGGLMVNAAIFDGNSGGTAQTPVPTTLALEGRTIGAAYRFGDLTAKASVVNYKVAGELNNYVYGAGLDYTWLPKWDLNGGVWFTSDRSDTTNHSLMAALGTEYYLSPETSLYAQIGLVDNHGAETTGLAIGALNAVQGMTLGADMGVRHTF